MADTGKTGGMAAAYLAKRADLVRFFTVRTSSAAEAEDIVQDIFLKIAGLDESAIENPVAYLYRLGSNVMLDRVRARRRAEARDGAYFGAHADAAGTAEPAAPAPSPEDAWASRRRLENVLRIMQEFPPQRRRVFAMHKLEGRSYGEVAAALGISKSAVEKHMMAALKLLAPLGEDR